MTSNTSTDRALDDGRAPDLARARLYDVMRRDTSVAKKVERALEVGEAYFDVDNGHVARVDPESDYWEAIASTGAPRGSTRSGRC